MVMSEKKNWFYWFKLALDIRSSVLRAIWRRVVGAMIFFFFFSWASFNGLPVNQPILAALIPSVVLGLLLVFRTNTAYDRFWEGRKLWGVMIHNGRILSRNLYFFIPTKTAEEQQTKQAYLRLVGTWLSVIKCHQRHEDLSHEVQTRLTDEQFFELKQVQHKPLRVSHWLADYFQNNYETDRINYRLFIELNQSLDSILNGMIGCDRISSTPLPKAYSIHLKHLLLIYCLSLPFTLVAELQWLTVPAVGVITFALLGIEEIGLEIENPFGDDPNDLPLEKYCSLLQGDIEELIQYGDQSSFSAKSRNFLGDDES